MAVLVLAILMARVEGELSSTKPHVTPLPHYSSAVHVNTTLPHAGLPVVSNVSYTCAYNATDLTTGEQNPMGTYNHGPIIAHVNGTFIIAWYNGPVSESQQNRVLLSTSSNGVLWSSPEVVFPVISIDGANGHGEQAEPFIFVNERMYIAASSAGTPAWNNTHDSGIRGAKIARRLALGPDGIKLGPIFWLSAQVPAAFHSYGFPAYTHVDEQTLLDGTIILQDQINTTMAQEGIADGDFNERSLYALPTRPGSNATTQLALWLRGLGKQNSKRSSVHADARIWASTCFLPNQEEEMSQTSTGDNNRIQSDAGMCVAGTGAYEYKLLPGETQRMQSKRSSRQRSTGPIQCNWTVPRATNIPDAPSRTCAGPLPDGNGVWTLGNQGGHGRDPLVVSTSADGITFDRAAVVAWDAPPVRYPGGAKGPGFQYPSGVWVRGPDDGIVMYAAYSISKEDIVVARFTL